MAFLASKPLLSHLGIGKMNAFPYCDCYDLGNCRNSFGGCVDIDVKYDIVWLKVI
jgi:hypothetical protein